MANVQKSGEMIIKEGRRIVCKIYDRPKFFKGLNVFWNENYPYSLEFNGLKKEYKVKEIDDIITDIQKYGNLCLQKEILYQFLKHAPRGKKFN